MLFASPTIGNRFRRPALAAGVFILACACILGFFCLKGYSQTAGLEGTWREQGDKMHTFQFRANGNVDAWYYSLPMGNFMTWKRNGPQITIINERGSEFVGELRDGEIHGREKVFDNTGKLVRTVDQVWRRENEVAK